MKQRSDLNQKIAERVKQLSGAAIRRLAASVTARQALAAETEKLLQQQRKEKLK
jgi:hypothetical protein